MSTSHCRTASMTVALYLAGKIQDSGEVPVHSSTLDIHRDAWITFLTPNRGGGTRVLVSKTPLDVSNGCPGFPVAEVISSIKSTLNISQLSLVEHAAALAPQRASEKTEC